jgi:ABC-type uncharacterized transport system ATPase subunit
MSNAPIEVTGLRKRYGPALALDGMSFTVQPGQVTGFVGPNGAGKSVTGLRLSFALSSCQVGGRSIKQRTRYTGARGRIPGHHIRGHCGGHDLQRRQPA